MPPAVDGVGARNGLRGKLHEVRQSGLSSVRKRRGTPPFDLPCAWQLIYKRLKEIGQLDRLKELKKPKNWRSSQSGECHKIIREDHRV
jgi:Methylene-tetrahydrofolate reductase C terminal